MSPIIYYEINKKKQCQLDRNNFIILKQVTEVRYSRQLVQNCNSVRSDYVKVTLGDTGSFLWYTTKRYTS